MGNLAQNARGIIAMATVDGVAGAPVYLNQRGFSSAAIVDNGAGDYTLTLDASNAIKVDMSDALVICTGIGTVATEFVVEYASATTLRVRCTSNAGALTDTKFSILVLPIGPN